VSGSRQGVKRLAKTRQVYGAKKRIRVAQGDSNSRFGQLIGFFPQLVRLAWAVQRQVPDQARDAAIWLVAVGDQIALKAGGKESGEAFEKEKRQGEQQGEGHEEHREGQDKPAQPDQKGNEQCNKAAAINPAKITTVAVWRQ
jgi:hypothetical protein